MLDALRLVRIGLSDPLVNQHSSDSVMGPDGIRLGVGDRVVGAGMPRTNQGESWLGEVFPAAGSGEGRLGTWCSCTSREGGAVERVGTRELRRVTAAASSGGWAAAGV